MTTPVHPLALKAYRERKRWTQSQLAEATRGRESVSLPTIKRIEGTRSGTYSANPRVATTLAKALGVEVEKLAVPPRRQADGEASLRAFGHRSLRTTIDPDTALAYDMVQHIYGIPIRSQIEMAPLFAALLAEASLAWRRERVAKIEEVAERLFNLGGGHFSFANAAYRALDGASGERSSIEERDLFGRHVGDEAFDLGFDPSQNNPFADFLEDLATKVDAKTVSFDKSFGWKTSEGLPEYQIGAGIVEELTAGDPEAVFALSRGHVRLSEIPKELFEADRVSERIAWMIAKIPPTELLERRSAMAELMGDFT